MVSTLDKRGWQSNASVTDATTLNRSTIRVTKANDKCCTALYSKSTNLQNENTPIDQPILLGIHSRWVHGHRREWRPDARLP